MIQSEITSTPKLSSIHASDRPQERLETLGAKALSDRELIAMILRSGSKGQNVLSVAAQLLHEAGSLADLVNWNDSEFKSIKGIGRVKALQLVSVVEICRRVLSQRQSEQPVIDEGDGLSAFEALCLGSGGREILGALSESKKPSDKTCRNHIRNGEFQLSSPEGGIQGGDTLWSFCYNLRAQPPKRRPYSKRCGHQGNASAP